jgi:hypothetical protein
VFCELVAQKLFFFFFVLIFNTYIFCTVMRRVESSKDFATYGENEKGDSKRPGTSPSSFAFEGGSEHSEHKGRSHSIVSLSNQSTTLSVGVGQNVQQPPLSHVPSSVAMLSRKASTVLQDALDSLAPRFERV